MITVRTRAAVASLVGVGDPCSRFGRRYPLANVLALIVAAGLANATRATLVAEWARDQGAEVRAMFGFTRRWPSVRTISRIMERVDAGQVDQVLSAWVAARDPWHVASDPGDGDGQAAGQTRPEPEPEPEPEPAVWPVRPVRDPT